MSDRYLRSGIFLAPFHDLPENPTLALERDMELLQLLDRLRREDNLALLFVSHDLNVVRMMCNRTIVLRNGSIVETGESRALFENPRDQYTRELVEAVPHIDRRQPRVESQSA